MAKQKKNQTEQQGIGIPALALYDLVKEKNGNVHPDYCFYHREWEEQRGSKTVPMKEEAVCDKINLDTLCCTSYLDPVKIIRPDNFLRGCGLSPYERNKKSDEVVLKINPIKLSKRLRREGKM